MSMRGGDFAGGLCIGDGLSSTVRAGRGISATGVLPESGIRHSKQRGASPTALCGRSAEIAGDDLPVVAMQTGGGQVQHDAPHGRLYPCAELHEMFAQGADLGGSQGRAGGAQTQLLVEHVGGGAQQPPQLIGEEAAAAGAVDFQAMMQLFDPILDVPAGAVDRLVQMPGRVLEVGDHETRVVFGLAPGMTHDLGFDDDAAALIPGAGGIASLAIQMLGLPRCARHTPGGAHQARAAALQNLVFPHRDHMLEPLAFEEGEHLGDSGPPYYCGVGAWQTRPAVSLNCRDNSSGWTQQSLSQESLGAYADGVMFPVSGSFVIPARHSATISLGGGSNNLGCGEFNYVTTTG